jgi:hypothetical protein
MEYIAGRVTALIAADPEKMNAALAGDTSPASNRSALTR